jgi:hypothetical protein
MRTSYDRMMIRFSPRADGCVNWRPWSRNDVLGGWRAPWSGSVEASCAGCAEPNGPAAPHGAVLDPGVKSGRYPGDLGHRTNRCPAEISGRRGSHRRLPRLSSDVYHLRECRPRRGGVRRATQVRRLVYQLRGLVRRHGASSFSAGPLGSVHGSPLAPGLRSRLREQCRGVRASRSPSPSLRHL